MHKNYKPNLKAVVIVILTLLSLSMAEINVLFP